MNFNKRMRLAQEKFAEGEAALKNANYQLAADAFLAAADLYKRITEQELSYAACLANAANAFCELGSYDQAIKRLEKALLIQKKLLSPDHLDIAKTLNMLAVIYKTQGKYERAESLCQQALAIRRKRLPTDDSHIASSLNNLAEIYREQRNYEKAEPLHKQALEMRQKVLPADHPYIAMSLSNLANTFRAQGQDNPAKSLHEQALEIRQKVLPPNHPDIARNLNNLANIYLEQHNYEQANYLYKQALNIYKTFLPDDHPDIATVLNNLALIYKEQGNHEQAKSLFGQANEIYSEKLGLNHPSTDMTVNNLADTIIKANLPDDNSFTSIAQLHEAVFQLLVDITQVKNASKIFPKQIFTLRTSKNDEQGRLSKGYWFLGDDESLHFSFWKGIDTTVQMPTIALLIDTQQKLSIHLNGKDSPRKAAFLADIANLLGGFAQVPDKNGTLEAQWKKTYSQTWEQALEEFLSTDKPQIDEYLAFKGNEIDDFTQISEKEFAQSLKFTVFLREKLKNSVEQELSEVGKPLKLQFLQLENIGHFKEVGFDLSKQVTILIGENGSGKSTVLKAIALGLSNVAQTMDMALVQDYLRIIKTDADKEHNRLKKQYCPTGEIRLGFQLNKLQTQTLEFKTTDLGGVEINPFIENNDDWLLVSQNRFIDLILGFPQGKKRSQKSLAKIKAPNLNDVLALIEERDTPEWKLDIKKWIFHLHTQRDENPQNLEKINTIFELFSKIIEDEDNEAFIRLKDAVYNSDTGEEDVIICTPDMPEGISLDLISQGYNNTFVWIGRLIMRLYDALKVHQQEHHAVSKDNKFLKNPNTRGKRYEANSIYELNGIVLIDEIDTYFHPKWQRNILQVLAETFPCLQFVVTSHSLAILSSLKDKDSYMIYRAFKHNEQIVFSEIDPHEQNPYGADLNEVAKDVMHFSAREPSIAKMLDELTTFIADKDIENAGNLVGKLETLINPADTELRKLKARLDAKKLVLSKK